MAKQAKMSVGPSHKSTPPHTYPPKSKKAKSLGETVDRTQDLSIFSAALSQLSYFAVGAACVP